MSLFRYPGGKTKIHKPLCSAIHQECASGSYSYCEPFFGGGSIGLKVLYDPAVSRFWFNDCDVAIAAVWNAVQTSPDALCEMIRAFVPSIDAFGSMKKTLLDDDLSNIDPVKLACMKIAIHQTSYSGLGPMSGGPLGGKHQKSAYSIKCRWNAESICKNVYKLHEQMKTKTVRTTNCDFEPVIRQANIDYSFIYLDPPYYKKGNELYQHGFPNVDDHKRLADTLSKCDTPWLLSYDDCPEIREMYSFAKIITIYLKYTINAKGKTREKGELLITSLRWDHVLNNYCNHVGKSKQRDVLELDKEGYYIL